MLVLLAKGASLRFFCDEARVAWLWVMRPSVIDSPRKDPAAVTDGLAIFVKPRLVKRGRVSLAACLNARTPGGIDRNARG